MSELYDSQDAGQVFEEYLKLLDQGRAPERDMFIAEHSPVVQETLKKIFSDYDSLGRWFKDSRSPSAPTEQMFGDYRLIREIGRGGMGIVWEAEQGAVERRVALKQLHTHWSIFPEHIKRFTREAKAYASVQHSGVVEILDYGEIGERYYIVQELIDNGSSLRDVLSEIREGRGQLPTGHFWKIADLVSRVAEALHHVHQAGIIHRDIKPSNILIDGNGNPKITDFGLARIVDQSTLSRPGEILGTTYYLSPEQILPGSAKIGPSADQFGLGATLFEALTLEKPFTGTNRAEIHRGIVARSPKEPRKIRRRVPRELEAICLKALEKDPRDRYESLDEMSTDLKCFLNNRPTVVRPKGRCAKAYQWTKLHPVKSLAICTYALIVGSLIGLMILMEVARGRAAQLEHEASLNRYVVQCTAIETAINEGDIELARELSSTAPTVEPGFEWDYYSLLVDPSLHKFTGWNQPIHKILIDPNEEYLLAILEDRTARILHIGPDLEDRRSIEISVPATASALDSSTGNFFMLRKNGEIAKISSPEWDQVEICGSIDGIGELLAEDPWSTSIAAISEDEGVVIFDLSSSDSSSYSIEASDEYRNVALSQVGKMLALTDENGDLKIWDLSTGQDITPEFVHGIDVGVVTFDREGKHIACGTSAGHLYVWPRANDLDVERWMPKMPDPPAISALAFSAQWEKLAIGFEDGSSGIWVSREVSMQKKSDHMRRRQAHQEWINEIALDVSGNFFYTASRDGSIVKWSATQANPSTGLSWAGYAISHMVRFSPTNAKSIATATNNGNVRIWDAETGNLKGVLRNKAGAVSIDIHPDLPLIAVPDSTGEITIWNYQEQEIMHSLKVSAERIYDAEFVQNGQSLLVCSGTHTLALWDWKEQKMLRELLLPIEHLPGIATTRDGKMFAYGLKDQSVRVANVDDFEELFELRGHEDLVRAYDFSPDGALLATGGDDNRIHVWNLDSGQLSTVLLGHRNSVTSVSFHPTQRRLVSTSTDRSIQIWDLETGMSVCKVDGHRQAALHAEFSPQNGNRLASVGMDFTVSIWESDRESLNKMRVHEALRRNLFREIEDLAGEYLLYDNVIRAIRSNRSWNNSNKAAALSCAEQLNIDQVVATDYRLYSYAWERLSGNEPFDVDETLLFAKELVIREPADDHNRAVLGLAYYFAGEYEKSIDVLKQARVMYGEPRGAVGWSRRAYIDAALMMAYSATSNWRKLMEAYGNVWKDMKHCRSSSNFRYADEIGVPWREQLANRFVVFGALNLCRAWQPSIENLVLPE